MSVEIKQKPVDVEDTLCGMQLDYGCCTGKKRQPLKILQRFATPRWALFFMSCLGFFQGFVINGMMNSVLTTIEKRFGLKSAESGLVMSSYDIASLFATAIVMYLGGRGHKPLWIGWGMILMGSGCIVFSLPHFAAPSYTVDSSSNGELLCSVNSTMRSTDSSLRNYVYALYFGNLMNGCGAAALYTLGLTYLDENVAQKYSSLYHGIYFAITGATGPAVGYLVSGALLQCFTNIGEKVSITTAHASWIGAWWPGYIASGTLIFLFSVPMLLMPRNLPGTEEIRKNRENEKYVTSHENEKEVKNVKGKMSRAVNFYKEFLVLLRNPPYLFMTFANCMDAGLIGGFSSFAPKYLETVFGVSAAEGAFYTGLVAVAGGSIGLSVGGLIVTKTNMKVQGMIKFCMFFVVFSLLAGGMFFLQCSQPGFAGATVPYHNLTSALISATNFSSSCNLHCGCNSDVYNPVCGDNDVTYFSPCYAGCTDTINNLGETYLNCSCVSTFNQTVTMGSCVDKQCKNLPLFLCLFFLAVCGTFMCWTPNVQVVIRIVPFSHRHLAVGLQWILNRALGGIPIPIIMGRLLDLACSVWSTEDGVVTSCRRYFNHQMGLYIFFVVLISKILAFVSYIAALLIYRRHKNNQSSNESELSANIGR